MVDLGRRLELQALPSVRYLEIQASCLAERIRNHQEQLTLAEGLFPRTTLQAPRRLVQQELLREQARLVGSVTGLEQQLSIRLHSTLFPGTRLRLLEASPTLLKENLPVFLRVQALRHQLDQLPAQILPLATV